MYVVALSRCKSITSYANEAGKLHERERVFDGENQFVSYANRAFIGAGNQWEITKKRFESVLLKRVDWFELVTGIKHHQKSVTAHIGFNIFPVIKNQLELRLKNYKKSLHTKIYKNCLIVKCNFYLMKNLIQYELICFLRHINENARDLIFCFNFIAI